ncbi:DNA protecting protein DprA [Enterococcus sp. AZ150]|uniref:DNA protecting protein DprA n=1 Tax=Enterococcus sulfureus ATCC 49903 TaxID=1140003 RepID=S0L5D3_9ENTE|nr:DNA-processing protein DprA [Enterococcus sulfureus]EOT47513.1 DNA protecting protein DprA [Enterococcus sulfureus ATCC 49903]EOT84066.1 DNA protecting protein DprA [Enterococcus sulfureus ATCC 49903]
MEKFKKLTSISQLLLRLTYSKGIGIVGKWKILMHLIETNTSQLSVSELSQIAQLHRTRIDFMTSFSALTSEIMEEKLKMEQFITYFDPMYPEQLRQISSPPLVLFYRGDITLLDAKKIIGIVGARQATSYAYKVIRTFIPELIKEEIVTISGLAKGVDWCAHDQTLRHTGKTIGVVACGLDYCYPKESISLFNEMCRHHLVLSEHPIGTKPKRHHFPMRNRVIAGIADGVCVVEAKQRSGALITAQLALEYGRDVFAVPGDILSGQSQGCHELILDGAICTTNAQKIINETQFYR